MLVCMHVWALACSDFCILLVLNVLIMHYLKLCTQYIEIPPSKSTSPHYCPPPPPPHLSPAIYFVVSPPISRNPRDICWGDHLQYKFFPIHYSIKDEKTTCRRNIVSTSLRQIISNIQLILVDTASIKNFLYQFESNYCDFPTGWLRKLCFCIVLMKSAIISKKA